MPAFTYVWNCDQICILLCICESGPNYFVPKMEVGRSSETSAFLCDRIGSCTGKLASNYRLLSVKEKNAVLPVLFTATYCMLLKLCLYVCVCVYVCMCVCVCMYVCMYVCLYECVSMYACMYVCMYVCVYIYIFIYMAKVI